MHPITRPCVPLFALAALACTSAARADDVPTIRLSSAGKTVEVVGLAAVDLESLANLPPESDSWPKVFAVYVDKIDRTLPPILGAWHVEGTVVRFEPRFPLVPGTNYRAVFDPAQIPGRKSGKAIEVKLSLPKPEPKAVAVVEQVYPTTNQLPENQLKFYLHFSAPMSRGESFRHIRLLDAAGKPVEMAFLEIDQELWDPAGKRFTLFIDPGRIKRGLKPREDLGPVLEAGKKYTLVVDRSWTDAADNPLKETFRKSFTAGPAEEKALDVKTWQLTAPATGGRGPLTVVFPQPLDHALLHRLVWVEDERGHKVAGNLTVDDEEKRWRFVPSAGWMAGKYQLVADTRLEDLAGNSLERPFEVDVFRPVQREIKTRTVQLPFAVR